MTSSAAMTPPESAPSSDAPSPAHVPVASYGHFLGFLGIVAGVVLLGQVAQHRQVAGDGLAASHAHVIPVYLSAAFLDWILLYAVWRGVRRYGGRLSDLVTGRWADARDVARDLGVALLFWGALLALEWAMGAVLGRSDGRSLSILLPQSPAEVVVWIATSATAGFCEEVVFRGYVQRQLLALWQRPIPAVLGQGILFGLMHVYQGWKPALTIAVIGVGYGALAVGRKSLRPGMLAHAWMDVWGGWLGRLLVGR